ncbi:MAG: hypothetical protein OWQ54_05085 [Sulfolobaceae archaeon]|nr:hypothetical protein [Sulfolobaceae archaeon]
MRYYRYSLINDELVPNDSGDIIVYVDSGFIEIVSEKEKKRLENCKFKILGEEGKLLRKLEELAKLLDIQIDERVYLAPTDVRSRIVSINRDIGRLFEEYLYKLLSKKYKVERNKEVQVSLSKFTGNRYYTKPDFIVEGRIAVEAKTGKVDYRQLIGYYKIFKRGVVAFPYSGECRVPPGWVCNSYTIKDPDKLYLTIDTLLR